MIRAKKILSQLFVFVLISITLSSCRIYTQHFMFRVEKSILKEDSSLFEYSEDNYILQVNDYIQLDVYTNNGEVLIDPNRDLMRALGGAGGAGGMQQGNRQQMFNKQTYLVLESGQIYLPMLGYIDAHGRRLVDVEFELADKFEEFYTEPYVRIKPLNRRVILFSNRGGQVIPLNNENMNLMEVLALGGEIATMSNAGDIKIIRGDLRDPEVQMVDLSTIEGMKKASLKIQPNDIIYVQAKRNRISEFFKSAAPITSFTSTILGLFLTYLAIKSRQ